MSSSRLGSGKQIKAVTFNQKEDRVLEKTLQTLELEQSYSLKLIHLHHREVKLNQKRMKQRIGKIRSNLDPEDIAHFQTMEYEGRLKSGYQPITATGALRIAAATKRLKLQSDRDRIRAARRAKQSPREALEPEEDTPQHEARDNATAGFMTLKPPYLNRRRNSACGALGASTPSPRPKSAVPPKPGVRPATCYGAGRLTVPRAGPGRPRTAPGYSSHTAPERSPSARANTKARRMSVMSSGSVESDLEKERDAEMRQELLDMEQLHQGHLEDRTRDFLQRAKKWAIHDPYLDPADKASQNITTQDRVLNTLTAISKFTSGTKKSSTSKPAQPVPPPHQVHMAGFTGVSSLQLESPEQERTRKLMEAWKDLNKCRYLRISDDDVDLSGVNTLAASQIKISDIVRTSKRGKSPKPSDYGRKPGAVGTVCQATDITSAITVEPIHVSGKA